MLSRIERQMSRNLKFSYVRDKKKNILLNLLISKIRGENMHRKRSMISLFPLFITPFPLLSADPFPKRDHFLFFSTRLPLGHCLKSVEQLSNAEFICNTIQCHFRAIAFIGVKGCHRCIFSQSETFNFQKFLGKHAPRPPIPPPLEGSKNIFSNITQ